MSSDELIYGTMASSLKTVLYGLLGMLLLVTLSRETQAQANPFDDSYTNCPAHLRLGALSGVRARHPMVDGNLRTDRIEVSWNRPDPEVWRGLGDRQYFAEITVIIDGPGDPLQQQTVLGSGSVTFENTALAATWKVWVAVTDQRHVISDISTLGAR